MSSPLPPHILPQKDRALATALLPRSLRRGRRVALISEGGGMRGAFGAGVLTGLAEAGLVPGAFDALFGVSAGVLNLAYWVSGRPRDATRIYADDILNASDPPFFLYQSGTDLLSRLARGQPAVD